MTVVYRYSAEGLGVNVYVVDTGVRTTHLEFGGRAFAAFNARPFEDGAGDCHGHGTHVAGIVGGVRSGVAKSVTLHSVRVTGCDGTGPGFRPVGWNRLDHRRTTSDQRSST